MSRSKENDGVVQASAPKKLLGTSDLEAKSEFYNQINDLYSQRYAALQDERMAAVKAAARQAYEILSYSGDWHVEDPIRPKQAAADAGTVQQFTSSLFPAIFTLVVMKCFSVYEERLEQDTDEARLERERYGRLKASGDVDAYAAESAKRSAKRFYDQWLRYASLDQAKEVAGKVINKVDDYVVTAAFSSLVDEVSVDVSRERWGEAFGQRIPEHADDAFKFFYVTFVDQKADDLLAHLNPTEMPFEELRAWAGITWLEGLVPELDVLAHDVYEKAVPALSMRVIQAVDRAARWLETRDAADKDGPAFLDLNSGDLVTYHAEGLPLTQAQAAVNVMSNRTADVWRWTTALIFAAWHQGASEPSRVWIDVREMCDALGYSKQKNGGHSSGNKKIVVRALRDLTRFSIQLALGSKVHPWDPRTGERITKRVIGLDVSEVLRVHRTEGSTILVDGERFPLRWEISAGEWIKKFPRQFAPLFISLVTLDGSNENHLLAKALGMELIWQYQKNKARTKVQSVREILKLTGVLAEANKARDKLPLKRNLEHVMDIVENLGICEFCGYHDDDLKDVEVMDKKRFTREAYEAWLDTRVMAAPSAELVQAMRKPA